MQSKEPKEENEVRTCENIYEQQKCRTLSLHVLEKCDTKLEAALRDEP